MPTCFSRNLIFKMHCSLQLCSTQFEGFVFPKPIKDVSLKPLWQLMDEAWAPNPPMAPIPPPPPAAPAAVPASDGGDDAAGGGGLADGVDTAPVDAVDSNPPTSVELPSGSGGPISIATRTIDVDGSVGDGAVDPTSGTPGTTTALGDDAPSNGELPESGDGDMAALLRKRTLVLGELVFSDDDDDDGTDTPVFSDLPGSPHPTPSSSVPSSASIGMPPPAVPSLADLEQRREALRAKKEALRSGVQKRESGKETNEHQINLQSCLLKVN